MKTLYFRKLSLEDKALVNAGCSACISLLYKKMKLEKWQCYLVVKTLFQEFPMEELLDIK